MRWTLRATVVAQCHGMAAIATTPTTATTVADVPTPVPGAGKSRSCRPCHTRTMPLRPSWAWGRFKHPTASTTRGESTGGTRRGRLAGWHEGRDKGAARALDGRRPSGRVDEKRRCVGRKDGSWWDTRPPERAGGEGWRRAQDSSGRGQPPPTALPGGVGHRGREDRGCCPPSARRLSSLVTLR